MNKFNIKRFGKLVLEKNIFAIVALLFIVPLIMIPEFSTPASITVLLKNISLWGIMAVGMTFVMLLGVFDMSIGMNVSLVTVILVFAAQIWGFVPGIIIALITGTFFGFLNGFIIAKLNINAFITTLSTMVLFKGIGLVLCGGSPILNTNETLAELFEVKIVNLGIFTITLPMLILAICLISASLVLKYTLFGLDVYVTGGNREAAKLAGINTDLIFIICYAIVGLCAGVTAVLLTSFQSSGNAAFGETYALQTIAACVLGGIRLSGGYGNALRAIFGVAALQLVIKILYYVASQLANFQVGIIGAIIIFVLILDKYSTQISNRAKKLS